MNLVRTSFITLTLSHSLSQSGNAIDLMYLDFSKVFHRVSHDILINKIVKCKCEWDDMTSGYTASEKTTSKNHLL